MAETLERARADPHISVIAFGYRPHTSAIEAVIIERYSSSVTLIWPGVSGVFAKPEGPQLNK